MIRPAAKIAEDRLAVLEVSMRAFYAAPGYPAFAGVAGNNQYHETCLRPVVQEVIARRGSCRILELGAGRTDIARFAATFPAGRLDVDTHDVTPLNREHLQACSRQVWIGEVADITGTYDVVFSTFAFEHVTRPAELLAQVDRLLAPGGWHVIICPDYGWRCLPVPSLAHRRAPVQLALALRIAWLRLRHALSGSPAFLINLDPACLHIPFRSDVDMVHLPSTSDLRRWCRARGWRWLPLPRVRGRAFKDRLVKGWLILCGACRKPE